MDNSLNYQDVWNKPQYINNKVQLFESLDQYLGQPPKRILDIGCGFAKVSELFQKKYGTELYLLESDISNSSGKRIGKWGAVDNFQWYLPVERLRQEWDAQGMTYTLVDGANIQIDPDIKFDLVYSWLSCGFHYPVTTYQDLIKKHTTKESVVVMDFRINLDTAQTQMQNPEAYEVVSQVFGGPKHQSLHIRFR